MSEPTKITYWFVFEYRRRPWRTHNGAEAPSKECHVVRSIPGDIVAAGKTDAEATARLSNMIQAEWSHHDGGHQAWWENAKACLTRGDQGILSEVFTTLPKFDTVDDIPFVTFLPESTANTQSDQAATCT